jgi:hypothetical protein
MDAVTYVKEYRRLCDEYLACVGCPLKSYEDCIDADPEELVKVVEVWSKEHPIMTNGMKVLELIPSDVSNTTITRVYPSTKDYVKIYIEKSWWDAEYKEGSNDD